MPVYAIDDETEYVFSGKRVKRGLYRASGKRYINADVNGAYNILRKRRPDAFTAKGVAGYVVYPYGSPYESNKTCGVYKTPYVLELF